MPHWDLILTAGVGLLILLGYLRRVRLELVRIADALENLEPPPSSQQPLDLRTFEDLRHEDKSRFLRGRRVKPPASGPHGFPE